MFCIKFYHKVILNKHIYIGIACYLDYSGITGLYGNISHYEAENSMFLNLE